MVIPTPVPDSEGRQSGKRYELEANGTDRREVRLLGLLCLPLGAGLRWVSSPLWASGSSLLNKETGEMFSTGLPVSDAT